MQKAQTIESPAAAKTRVTDRLDSLFDTKCIKFRDTENEKLLNQIRLHFEAEMRDALAAVSSSKIDQAVNIATTLGKSTLLNLDPCNMDYNNFKALKKNTCGENGGDCAINSRDYAELSKQFQKQAEGIFLQNFLYKISEIAKNFKKDINLLEKQKQSEQDRLTEEKNAKTIQASNDLSGLDNIFTNRVGRGFFKIFGGGKPSLKALLIEVGCPSNDVQGITDKNIDKAKSKLIDKFGDAEIAELAFKAACENKFNREVFARLEVANNKNSQLIDLAKQAIHEKKKLEKENQEMKAEIEEYKNAVQKIQNLDNRDISKEKISAILQTMADVHYEKLQGTKDIETLMKEFNDSMAKLNVAMKVELAKQANDLEAKLQERKQQKNATTVPQVQDNNLQSKSPSPKSNRSQSLHLNFYKGKRRSSSSLSNESRVEKLVHLRRNSSQSKSSQNLL